MKNCYFRHTEKQKPKTSQNKPKEFQFYVYSNFNKSTNIKSNISDYETEQSFPKNNSNKQMQLTSNLESDVKTLTQKKKLTNEDIANKNAKEYLYYKKRREFQKKISSQDKLITELQCKLSFYKKQVNLCEKINSKKKSYSLNKSKPNDIKQNGNTIGKQISNLTKENNLYNNLKSINENIHNYKSLKSEELKNKNFNIFSNVVYQKKKGNNFLNNNTKNKSKQKIYNNNFDDRIKKNIESVEKINENNINKDNEEQKMYKKATDLIIQFFEYYENLKNKKV